jgi:hypothetical protein
LWRFKLLLINEKQFFWGISWILDMDRTIRFLKDACVRWAAIGFASITFHHPAARQQQPVHN